jgi:hypothetical protein
MATHDDETYTAFGVADLPDELDRDAVVDAMIAFWVVLGGYREDVDLIITSDFEEQVKAHLEPAWAAMFTQDRGPYGRCMAKTMLQPDGHQVVVADVHLFLKGAPNAEPTFRHEALHALLHLRDESTNRSRETVADHAGVHPDLVAMAGIAAEEYRVERAVDPDRDDLWASFEALCIAAHDAIHSAAIAYYRDHDVEAIWNTVMNAFAPITVQAAYVAAWLDADELDTTRLANADLDSRMLGEAWPPVIAALRALPSANAETDRTALDAMVMTIARRFEEWLAEIGFACEQLPNGQLFFHVHEHEDWVTRSAVGQAPTP